MIVISSAHALITNNASVQILTNTSLLITIMFGNAIVVLYKGIRVYCIVVLICPKDHPGCMKKSLNGHMGALYITFASLIYTVTLLLS